MEMIMRDYARLICIDIPAYVEKAMAPDSGVLVTDILTTQGLKEAAILGQCVMTMAGKERAESGLKSIMESAGLKLMKVLEGSEYARRLCIGMFEQCVWRIGKRK